MTKQKKAENMDLGELVGMVCRKALEILINDFLIQYFVVEIENEMTFQEAEEFLAAHPPKKIDKYLLYLFFLFWFHIYYLTSLKNITLIN